ncbi:MAG: ABC transporter ATP-binding protein [Chloroflexi bacterium]|nr:ABC transporter ATP-binding protein [Chloroflexota bacterium]
MALVDKELSQKAETTGDEEPNEMSIRRMITWSLSYWRSGMLIIVLLFIQQLFRTFYAINLKFIVDNAIAGTNDPPLSLVTVVLLAGFLVAILATIVGDYFETKTAALIVRDIRRSIFQHLQRLSLDFYQQIAVGEVVERFSADMEALKFGITKQLAKGIMAIIGLAINIPVLFFLEPRLALMPFIAIPLTAFLIRRLAPRAKRTSYQYNQFTAKVLNTPLETVRGQTVIKAFGLQPIFETRFISETEELADKEANPDSIRNSWAAWPVLV